MAPKWLGPLNAPQGAILFVGGLTLVVLFLGLWSRVVARNVCGSTLQRNLARFNRSLMVARLMIPVWFGVAVFLLGWGNLVTQMLGPIKRWPVELPGLLIGTMPAFLAWMGLWWAQYPADCAIREQTIFQALEQDLPVRTSPKFWSYFVSNLRLQVLFTIVPIALIVFVHDVASAVLWNYAGMDLRSPHPGTAEGMAEITLQLLSVGMVVLFAPEVLRRVLHTEPLPQSPLRQRLEELCRKTGMKYRDILLWQTNNNMGNAAVMGLIPRMRYILLSDMLLETMTDKQVEAVFAHEIGHVKHRHMVWYVALIVAYLLLCFGPGQLLGSRIEKMQNIWMTPDMFMSLAAVAGFIGFFLVFGYLSRWFERQADVFAARTIEHEMGPTTSLTTLEGVVLGYQPISHVGPHGASVFASALHRVAVINNIPVSAGNFTHGSIAERMEYLHTLSIDPTRTTQFDRTMSVVYASLVLALLACGAWVMIALAA